MDKDSVEKINNDSNLTGDLAWCAADGHFYSGDPAWPVFLDWLESFRTANVANLVLLGDIFQVWVGLSDNSNPEQEELLSVLANLSKEGKNIVYLLGNRDYFLEKTLSDRGVLVREWWETEADGKLIRFEHGDLINHSDTNYLRWRLFSRSGSMRSLVSNLPPGLQKKLSRKLEGDMAGTNQAYKNYKPSEELRLWAEELVTRGVSRAILGHFHIDAARRIAGLPVRFLPQFRENGSYLIIDRLGRDQLTEFLPTV